MSAVAGLAMAGAAAAQTTSLTVNGVTSSGNTGAVTVPDGTTFSVTISNATLPNRTYGLFGATANTGVDPGWFLATNTVPNPDKLPFPLLTGVATSVVEADYPPLDIFPDRSSNPRIKLNGSGSVTLNFRVPTGATGTLILQAAVLESSGTSTDFSNAITVTFAAPGNASRMVVSRAAAAGSVDAVAFGVLQFSGGSPAGATFTADSTLTNIKVDGISLADINEWATHQQGTALDKAREVDYVDATFGPALNNDNHEYPRVNLPPVAGGVPARVLMRCYDNVSLEGFFMVVNRGDNPNVAGDVFAIPGTRFKDTVNTALNSWKGGILVSPDGTRAAAIYDDSSAAINPKLFLFTTDGSRPFLDALSNPTNIIDVTPTGVVNFSLAVTLRAAMFSDNFLFFAADKGAPVVQELYSVDIRATRPTPNKVTIATNSGYSSSATTNNHIVDTIADRSFLRPRNDASLVVFLAGDTFVSAGAGLPDHMTKADWYAVHEATPTKSVNLTKFRLFPPITGAAPKMATPGEMYNGVTGQAVLSPDGSRLAFISIHNEESTAAGDDDEIYLCSTNDTDGNGEGDDAGDSLFVDGQVTLLSRIGTSVATGLDDGVDLYLKDADNLYFFYGFDTSATDKLMDLFHWKPSTQVLTNVTRGGSIPFTTAGTILPEGYFFSPNGRYLYFSRGLTSTTAKTNLVGVDTTTVKAFNITGNEFSGATTADTENPAAAGDNFNWHLSFAGGLFPSLCTFAAQFDPATAQNVFLFDADYPTAALQITNDTGVTQSIESLTANPHALGLSWAVNRTTSAQTNFQYQDLLFFFRDSLNDPTSISTFTLTATLDAWAWVRAATSSDPTGAAPPALIVAIGDDATRPDNPNDAEFYYFSLNGTTDQDFDDGTHEIGTTSVGGARFSGFIQVYHADVN
jgi:hypothetical protein